MNCFACAYLLQSGQPVMLDIPTPTSSTSSAMVAFPFGPFLVTTGSAGDMSRRLKFLRVSDFEKNHVQILGYRALFAVFLSFYNLEYPKVEKQ